MAKSKRPDDRLKPITLTPISEDEALGLLLKTPPPPQDDAPKRKATKKRKNRK